MTEHSCIQGSVIATLVERTQNFDKRFDGLHKKTDAQTEKLDKFTDDQTAKLDKIEALINSIDLKLAVERVDNKWKHRFNMLLFGAGGGAVGSGGIIGLLKAIGTLK